MLTLESRTSTTYDVDGNLPTLELDNNADGAADSRTTYTYDGDGRMLTEMGCTTTALR